MKVGFVGVGKLGKDASEVMAEHYDVTGYDINDVVTTIKMADTLEECCKDKDVVFIAVPTAHDPEYRWKISFKSSKNLKILIILLL